MTVGAIGRQRERAVIAHHGLEIAVEGVEYFAALDQELGTVGDAGLRVAAPCEGSGQEGVGLRLPALLLFYQSEAMERVDLAGIAFEDCRIRKLCLVQTPMLVQGKCLGEFRGGRPVRDKTHGPAAVFVC